MIDRPHIYITSISSIEITILTSQSLRVLSLADRYCPQEISGIAEPDDDTDIHTQYESTISICHFLSISTIPMRSNSFYYSQHLEFKIFNLTSLIQNLELKIWIQNLLTCRGSIWPTSKNGTTTTGNIFDISVAFGGSLLNSDGVHGGGSWRFSFITLESDFCDIDGSRTNRSR